MKELKTKEQQTIKGGARRRVKRIGVALRRRRSNG